MVEEETHTHLVRQALRRMLPPAFLLGEGELHTFEEQLPLLKWVFGEEGNSLSLFFLTPYRLNVGHFFYEMIQKWLKPGERVEISFFFCTDFTLPTWGEGKYTLAEMVVRLKGEEKEMLEHNLRIIQTEIQLGMVSFYHTHRILEMHTARDEGKKAFIQEKITFLIQKRPDEIDYDILGEMQHFFVMSKEEFCTPREGYQLCRLITFFYLFRKALLRKVEKEPDKRYVCVKLSIVHLHFPWGVKRVLGVCVGLNFLKQNELFEERHLIKAIQNTIEGVRPVSDSFFVNEGGEERIHTLYIEMEKEGEFSREEILKLKETLPTELKRAFEVALRPLFMPRNEEEVMRHIVTLAGQIRFVKDCPQVIVSFEEQEEEELVFTAIVVRILFPQTASLQQLLKSSPSSLSFTLERTRRIGMLRKKYPKEATVFRVRLKSENYLRDDYAVDLFRARQEVIVELTRLLGEIRDYNGGMISKQIEALERFKERRGEMSRQEELLVETVFHTLYPIEMRSILPVECLQTVFELWKKLLADPGLVEVVEEQEEALFYLRRGEEETLLSLEEERIVVLRPYMLDEKFIGYIYFTTCAEERKTFLQSV